MGLTERCLRHKWGSWGRFIELVCRHTGLIASVVTSIDNFYILYVWWFPLTVRNLLVWYLALGGYLVFAGRIIRLWSLSCRVLLLL